MSVTPLKPSESEIPAHLASGPKVSALLVLDERMPLIPFLRALAIGGYTVLATREGQLVVTHSPSDWLPKP